MAETLTILQDHYRGVAGVTSCKKSPEDFKKITDYDSFITARSKRRKPSALREITKTISTMPPHTIKFAVGVPNVNTFPFQEFHVKLKDGSSYNIEGGDLEAALQYMPSSGHTTLVRQLQDLQDKTHGTQDWNSTSLVVTCGASEPMASAFDLVLDQGDPIIIPVPLYTGTADALRAYKPEYIALQQDKDGVQPSQLRQILNDRVNQGKPMPKLMYINPTGCNPTGRNLPLERRQELYQIACDYNFLIVEDDPYHLLHFLDVEWLIDDQYTHPRIWLFSHVSHLFEEAELGFNENIPSLLSMDVEGRVIRLDSFSKILSSGLRVGYVTGPSPLIRKIELHLQVTTLHTSALSQNSKFMDRLLCPNTLDLDPESAISSTHWNHWHHRFQNFIRSTSANEEDKFRLLINYISPSIYEYVVVSKLLDHWGYNQYLTHVKNVRKFYKERRDLMLAACEKYLTGLAKWDASSGGMFLWLQVPVLKDTWSLATKHCLEKCLLIVPGHPFTGDLTPPTYNYIRLSFSLASPAQMDEGVKLLAKIITEQAEGTDLK